MRRRDTRVCGIAARSAHPSCGAKGWTGGAWLATSDPLRWRALPAKSRNRRPINDGLRTHCASLTD
jgi:hypothetical protein